MQEFVIRTPRDAGQAAQLGAKPGAALIAGGTDLMQLWKNDVERASEVIDLQPLGLADITELDGMLRIGALATMAEIAAHPAVRGKAPMVSEALLASASPQIRNMGTGGGNLLQRTRCGYFRDTGFACNKRDPGSGCPAITGDNRTLAIFGGSPRCIATHPADMPVALVALGASVEIRTAAGATHSVPLEELYVLPGETPDRETVLQPGDLITAINLPLTPAASHSTYVKVRDRQSFAFGLVSVAAGLDVQGGVARDVRLAAGGVGTKPWRLHGAEAVLRGKRIDDAALEAAARQARQGAAPQSQNAFKIVLLQNAVRRALQTLAAA